MSLLSTPPRHRKPASELLDFTLLLVVVLPFDVTELLLVVVLPLLVPSLLFGVTMAEELLDVVSALPFELTELLDLVPAPPFEFVVPPLLDPSLLLDLSSFLESCITATA